MMDKMIKESVATLFCHAIKLDDKDMRVEQPIFCRFMGQDFDCKREDAKNLLDEIMQRDEGNIDTHIAIVSNALHNEPYKKMNILKQLNHIIFKSKMRDEDYEYFEKVKSSFFTR
jgi:hypothetical protein